MTAPAVIIPAGLLALVAAILAYDELMRHDWSRARQYAWVTGQLLIGAALTLAAGTRRAGSHWLRKLAGWVRAIRPAAKQAGPGRHRKAATAR